METRRTHDGSGQNNHYFCLKTLTFPQKEVSALPQFKNSVDFDIIYIYNNNVLTKIESQISCSSGVRDLTL